MLVAALGASGGRSSTVVGPGARVVAPCASRRHNLPTLSTPTRAPHATTSTSPARSSTASSRSIPPALTIPWLATTWEQSADGLTWRLTLREGVTFHDGTPFNAEAVKFNFDRIKDPATRSVTTAGYWGPYESTTVVDEYTVDVAFSEPYAPFLAIISNELFGIKSPAAATESGDDFGRNPVGSGPFVFVEWIDGDHVTLRKNPDYNWAPANATHQGRGVPRRDHLHLPRGARDPDRAPGIG